MDDHRSARSILQRALVGGAVPGLAKAAVAVDQAELERALAHVASCEECRLRFDVADTAAWLESREETHGMAQAPVDPPVLFERSLTAALSDPDDITRRRAAERLGEMTELGAAAVHALVAAAGEDRDERVRAAALTAVQRLDMTVSLPQWAIDVWSAAPAEAGAYLADVLARLAAPAGATGSTGVVRLSSAGMQDDAAVALAGDRGVRARVTREPDGLWLTVEGLPVELERTTPVVAVPEALVAEQTAITWAGDEPGLVAAIEPVSGGSLRVRLGDVEAGGTEPAAAPAAGAPPADQSALFDQIFLLHPEDRREKA
jgi:hypothetical protein